MAAISQRIVWTLLPNGFDAGTGKLKASVLISPRLTLQGSVSPQNLSWFPDWKSWPEVITAAQFAVSVDGGPPHVVAMTSKPDKDVWAALFPPTTYVKPYAFTDMRGKVILSYPVAALANAIEGFYGRLGLQAEAELPTRRQFAALAELQRQPLTQGQVLEALRAEAKGGFRLMSSGSSAIRQPSAALDLLAAYHAPLEAQVAHSSPDPRPARKHKTPKPDPHAAARWNSPDRVKLPAPAEFKDIIDFHQIVSSLAQYPELNKLAGLVVSLEFDPGLVPDGLHALRLDVHWPKAGGGVQTDPDVTPTIMVHKQGQTFEAAAKAASSAVTSRFLKLKGGGFDLVEIDVDGAGMKLKNFATNIVRPQPVVYDDDTFDASQEQQRAGAPSLRSAGLMLAQERRDLAVQTLFAGSGDLQDKLTGNMPLPALYADDTIRGYRVDIRDDATKLWRSLCFRQIDFGFVNTGKSHTTAKEEGMIRLAAASSADGSNPDVLKIHEGLFAWKGWSLCAPEPGKVLLPDETVGEPDETPPPGLPLKTHFTVTPKSLPQLRFGRSYTVRVRLVDLAGESAEFNELDIQPLDALSQSAFYLRYEPVESPSLALVKGSGGVEEPADGESMERIVIRTFNDDPSKNTIPIKDRTRRHLVPPRSTHRFAEQHGVMDTASGKLDPALFSMLAKLDNPLDAVQIKRPGPQPSSPAVPITFAVAPEGFTLPYLPDPLALGVAIKVTGVEGVNPNTIHKIPLYGSTFDPAAKPNWPYAQPFTIVAAENGAPDAAFDPSRREFVVPMRKAERARVRISSLIPKAWPLAMAVSKMILEQKPTAAQLAFITALIENGQHWMYTPWRTIELVHAVQKPLVTPDFATAISIQRALGSIAATPVYRTPLHSKSTVRIDLYGRWTEPVDDPAAATPAKVDHAAHVYDVKISRTQTTTTGGWYSSPGLPHVFADTRYRRVIYTLDATTRFREFMPDKIRNDPTNLSLKVTSAEKRAWVPNAAAPPPPNLLYVVPTFGWVRQTSGGQAASFRAGGGLRVYLDRPWFATGYGEMLGVVLPPGDPGPPGATAFTPPPMAGLVDGAYRAYVTQWGSDPIWSSGRIHSVAPQNSAFPLAKWRAPITFDGTALPPEEGSDLPPGDFPVSNLPFPPLPQGLNVAPHQVGYDPDRHLWYADIVVRPPANTYYPFIRLALARYHPVSVEGAHLSTIVMAEFQQLTPHRLAIVTHGQGGQSAHVAVYGSGTAQSVGDSPQAGLFRAETQVLDAGADPDLGWRTVEPQAAAAAAAAGEGEILHPSYLAQALVNQPPPQPSTPLQIQADQLLAKDNFAALLARPDLTFALQPPLLWQADVALPAIPPGGRRRLLITESERYQTSREAFANRPAPLAITPMSTRIVYLETMDV